MEYKTSVYYAGGESTYTFPFEYLQKSFVKVRYQKPDGVLQYLAFGKDYTIEENRVTLITLPDREDKVNIYRSTPTDRMVKYVDASILKAHDMNVNELQTLHIMEEQTDYLTAYALFRGDKANVWEAGSLRIINLAAPLEPTDAVNKAYVDEYGVTWQQNVAQMKKQLQDQDNNIAKQLQDQQINFNNQLNEQDTSFNERIASHDTELLNKVEKWAQATVSPDNALDTSSPTGKTQSSKSWALYSKDRAAASAASANAAKTSEGNAANSASTATAQANASATSATAAKASEDKAKISEVNAKASEVAAAASANQAANGQINADWNETNANSKAYIKNKPDLANSVTTKALTVTGETSVPTANEGNSSNTIASTEFVAKSLAKMVDSAPESLNTLNELAKALGNDPNFATTVINELAKKLNSNEAENTYVKQGGVNLWNALHNNTTSNLNGLTNAQWNALGFFIRYFGGVTAFENQPSTFGQLINISANKDSEATQLFIEQNSGKIYFRGGNATIAMKDVKFKEVAYWNDNKHLQFPNGAEMWVS